MAVYKSKKPTKDGRQYFFRIKYKDIIGVSHDYTSQKYKTQKEAVNEEALYRIKIGEKKNSSCNITIKQAFLEYIENKKTKVKKQTINRDMITYKQIKMIENKKINSIDIATYQKWYSYLGSLSYNTRTLNKVLGLFKNIIIYSNKYYNTDDSILKYIENFKDKSIKKDMDFYTYDEYLKFDSVISDIKWHTFFEVLYFLGLRKGECMALKWSDVDFNQKTINIDKTVTTKIKGEVYTITSPKTKNSNRKLPITEKIYNDFKSMFDDARTFKDFSLDWFIFGNIKPFPETTIKRQNDLYSSLAGVKTIRIHDFRHSTASLLINKGASIALVSKYLGHSNISMTLNTYTHMYKSELDEMTDILNNL